MNRENGGRADLVGLSAAIGDTPPVPPEKTKEDSSSSRSMLQQPTTSTHTHTRTHTHAHTHTVQYLEMVGEPAV